TTEAGRDALGYYHEKKPEHDWSSHAADAFGLMAIKYEEPGRMANFRRKLEYPPLRIRVLSACVLWSVQRFCGAVELLQKLVEHLIVKTVSLCLRMINCFAESRLKL